MSGFKNQYIVTENGLIGRVDSNAQTDLKLPNHVFDSFKSLAMRQETDGILDFFVLRNQEFIKTRNHVGLVQTADGFWLEILPKITDKSVTARIVLLNMLRCVPDFPFKSLKMAQLETAQMPIWEIFISTFLDELEKIMHRGLQRSYQLVESESGFLHGKWLIHKQLQQSKTLKTQFLIEHDLFHLDTPPNRIIKTCLAFLKTQTHTSLNVRRLTQIQVHWQDVPISTHIPTDLLEIQSPHRSYIHYQTALQWAAVFLANKSWLGQSGQSANVSLLFPMERLFEQNISYCFKKYMTDFEIFTQQSNRFLIDDHAGKAQYKLRPDLMLHQNEKILIADAKWKQIDDQKPNNQYGIDQRDLYQLYAYGQKYEASALFLIYPANRHFTKPLPPFRYDDKFSLWALPFDLTIAPSEAIKSVNLAVKAALV
jgi:5-methylcytosine-specific restriction enzyme subunit McrC